MHPLKLILALAAISLAAFCISPAFAQRSPRGGAARTPAPRTPRTEGEKETTPIEEFETLSPEQQQKALNRLPPEQRQKLQERLKQFNQLPPQQQQALKTLYNRLHQLPPTRQETVRKAISKLSEQAPDRQQAIREELRNLAAVSPSQRQAEMASSDFRSRFNKKEQQIVKDMSPLLPEEH